jgi:hypothetical protein
MMGLEPTTFCMANASERSRPFAWVRSSWYLQAFRFWRANGSEPERTPNLAILATGAVDESAAPIHSREDVSATLSGRRLL